MSEVPGSEVAEREAMPRVAMVDLSRQRERRDELRRSLGEARTALAAAERRRAEHNAGLTGRERLSVAGTASVLHDEVVAFQAAVDARQAALGDVERELARFETPERLAAVAAQSAEWTKAREDVLAIVGEIEQGTVYLKAKFEAYVAARARMLAARVGHAQPERELNDGDRRRFARQLVGYLKPFVAFDRHEESVTSGEPDFPRRELAQMHMAPDLIERYG